MNNLVLLYPYQQKTASQGVDSGYTFFDREYNSEWSVSNIGSTNPAFFTYPWSGKTEGSRTYPGGWYKQHFKAFDPFPFILLNLVLSCVAAIQAPLIMMSQNRQEEKDRRRAENDYKVNLKTEIMIEDLYDKINTILKKQILLEKKLLEKMRRKLQKWKYKLKSAYKFRN